MESRGPPQSKAVGVIITTATSDIENDVGHWDFGWLLAGTPFGRGKHLEVMGRTRQLTWQLCIKLPEDGLDMSH